MEESISLNNPPTDCKNAFHINSPIIHTYITVEFMYSFSVKVRAIRGVKLVEVFHKYVKCVTPTQLTSCRAEENLHFHLHYPCKMWTIGLVGEVILGGSSSKMSRSGSWADGRRSRMQSRVTKCAQRGEEVCYLFQW